MRVVSVGRKLTLINLAATGLALSVFSVQLVFSDWLEFRRALLNRLMVQAEVIGDDCRAALDFDDPAGAERALSALKPLPELIQAVIYDAKRQPFAIFPHGAAPRPPPMGLLELPVRLIEGGEAMVSRPLAWEGRLLGAILIVSSTDETTRRVFRYLLFLGFGATVAMLAAMLLISQLRRTIVSPVEKLTRLTQDIARTQDFSERCVVESNDELGILAHGFNDMLGRLQARDAELARHRAGLEDEVASRTALLETRAAELSTLNVKLTDTLDQLKKAQDDLLQSTRLASIGEVAGRVAHEVLNPLTSIHGRLTRLIDENANIERRHLGVLRDITDGWRDSYGQEGFDGLNRSLSQPVKDDAGKTRPLVEEDLANLSLIREHFEERTRHSHRDLAFLLRQVDRVAAIVDSMRGLARHAATRDEVNVEMLIAEAIEIVSDSAAKRNIKIQKQVDGTPVLWVDRNELIQIITNLLRNAMQAIEQKSGRQGGHIWLIATQTREHVQIRIRDDGTGIRPEHIPLLFEAAFTTRSPEEGTGLGLSISRRLARAYQGDLRLEETRWGEGTTFLMELPRTVPTPVVRNEE